MSLRLLNLPDGSRAAAMTGSWSGRRDRAKLQRWRWPELWLNDSYGFKDAEAAFLIDIPELVGMSILSRHLTSLDVLTEMPNLAEVKIPSYEGVSPNFAAMPALRSLHVEWRKGYDSLFMASSVRELSVYRYPDRRLEPVLGMVNLERLSIVGPSPMRSLHGIGALSRLQTLSLSHLGHLSDLSGIEGAATLRALDIDTCGQVSSLEPLAALTSLAKLSLHDCGKFESLSAVSELAKTAQVSIDGVRI